MSELLSPRHETEIVQHVRGVLSGFGMNVIEPHVCGLDPAEYQTASCSGFGRGPRSRLCVFVDTALAKWMTHALIDTGPSDAGYHASLYPWSWLKAHTYDPPPKPRPTFGEFVVRCRVECSF